MDHSGVQIEKAKNSLEVDSNLVQTPKAERMVKGRLGAQSLDGSACVCVCARVGIKAKAEGTQAAQVRTTVCL